MADDDWIIGWFDSLAPIETHALTVLQNTLCHRLNFLDPKDPDAKDSTIVAMDLAMVSIETLHQLGFTLTYDESSLPRSPRIPGTRVIIPGKLQ